MIYLTRGSFVTGTRYSGFIESNLQFSWENIDLENLKAIELKCCDFDKSVCNIIELLISCSIPIGKISICFHDDYEKI
jgi:hypothetical protein